MTHPFKLSFEPKEPLFVRRSSYIQVLEPK